MVNVYFVTDQPISDVVISYFERPSIKLAIQKMSPVGQTSRVESYHHVILSFAPKHMSFGYQGMVSRSVFIITSKRIAVQSVSSDNSIFSFTNACVFSYRLLLAAIHYNENCDREPVMDGGAPVLQVKYLKYRHGRGSARLIRPPPTYGMSKLHCRLDVSRCH